MHKTLRPVRARHVSDLTPGTIVRVKPVNQFANCPVGAAVVLGTWGPVNTATTVLCWFWGAADTDAGQTIYPVWPEEAIPQTTQLQTLPEGAFLRIAAILNAPTRYGLPDVEDLQPLSAAVTAAAEARGLDLTAIWRCETCRGLNALARDVCRYCRQY